MLHKDTIWYDMIQVEKDDEKMSSNIRISRICSLCNKEFIAKTTVTKYCGDVCAKRAYKKKKKNEKVEKSNEETLAIKTAPIKGIQEQQYLSISDTCKLLGISRMTLYRLVKNNTIHATKIGRRTIISKKAIDKIFNPEK